MHDTNHQSRITNHVGYEIRENDMLENKTTYRSVGTALAAIGGLALAAFLVLAPSAALADDECGVQVGTTPVDCDQASYGSGVTYDAVGDLFIDFTNTPTTTIGGSGITLTGSGSEDITFDSATTETELQNQSGMAGALLGVTTANGDIVIDTEEMDADANSAADVTHGIYAESTGSGSIDITFTGFVDAGGVNSTNPVDSIGIEAITGSGDLTITSDSAGVAGNATGIAATTGTGLLTINAIGTDNGFLGQVAGILANAGGDMEINVGAERGARGLDLTAAGEAVVNNDGTIGDGNSRTSTSAAIEAGGNTLTLNNGGVITGFLDFADLSSGYTFNNNAGAEWNVGPFDGSQGAELGEGALNNDGLIRFARGSYASAEGTNYTGGYTGGDNGVLEMVTSVLDGAGQPSCTSPTISSCLDLSGGSTAGLTSIRFLATENPDPLDVPLAPPINPGIVVVDVGGGDSDASHFMLDPESTGYAVDEKYDAVLVTGDLFDYTLLYNPTNQQHVLTSVPRREGVEYVSFIQESLSIWHTTTDAVVGRQADLQEGGARGGWARIVRSGVDRDARPTLITHGNTFVYDNDYSLDTTALVAGYDMTFSDSYVIGLHGGLMSAGLEYDHSGTRDEAKGAMAGMYAGWWNDMGLTLDGALNINFVTIDHKMPDYENSETNAISYGVRAEAGWRWAVSESFYVQPLASAAYVQGNLERLDLRYYDATFENDESMRAALGVRLGGDMDLSSERFSSVRYWLTARAWDESAGDDAQVRFKTESDPLIIEDDLSGSFEEVGLGVSLTSSDEKLSVFFSGNGQFGDETDSLDVTVGVRLYW